MRVLRTLGAAARRGFTLAEVLVTLLIVGWIMLAIAQMLEAARISRDTIHNIQETQLAGPAILDLVERDLRAITIYGRQPVDLLRVNNRIVIGLDADGLDFVTTRDGLIGQEIQRRRVRGDYNEVGYRLRPNPRDDDFLEIYRRESLGIDQEPFDGGQYTFLHDRVRGFDIKVYEEDGPDAQPLDEWNPRGDRLGLPLRLEIALTLELAPRISREQLRIAPVDKRLVTYKRVVRLPGALFDAVAVQPKPLIPILRNPAQLMGQGQGGGAGAPGAGAVPGGGPPGGGTGGGVTKTTTDDG